MAELFQIEIAVLDLIPVVNFLLCTIYKSRYQVKVMQCKSVSTFTLSWLMAVNYCLL